MRKFRVKGKEGVKKVTDQHVEGDIIISVLLPAPGAIIINAV